MTSLPTLDPANDVAISAAMQKALHAAGRRAGAQFNPDLPPWSARGHRFPASPVWPDREAKYHIPLAIPVNEMPPKSATQQELNAFLARLDEKFFNKLGQAEQASGNDGTICSRGPTIYHREISSTSDTYREKEFGEHYDVKSKAWYTNDRAAKGRDAGIALSEYSAVTSVFVRDILAKPGTLALFASREQWTHGLRETTQVRHVERLTKKKVTPEYLVKIAGRTEREEGNPAFWHNTAVFIQSRRGCWPVKVDDVPASAPIAQRWRFNGDFQACIFYDPTFPSESLVDDHTEGPASQALKAPGHQRAVRIHDLTFHRTVSVFLTGTGGVLDRNNKHNKKEWVAEVMTIGGGGNEGGLEACRRMSLIWMQQVATLS